jgi:tetratricopeptide (TPR) repeat protein
MYGNARDQLEPARELIDAEPRATPREVIVTMLTLADIDYNLGRYDLASEAYEESLGRCAGSRPPMPDLEAHALVGRGSCLRGRGELDEAERVIVRALDICDDAPGELDEIALDATSALYAVYLDARRFEEAEPLIRAALERRVQTLGERHPESITALGDLGLLYSRWGRYEKAEPLLVEALELDRQVRGAPHEHTLATTANYAEFLLSTDRADEARPLLDRMVSQARRRPAHHWTLGRYIRLQGDCRVALGMESEAEDLYLEAYDVLEETLGADHRRTSDMARALSSLYETLGRRDDARAWSLKASAQPG